MKRTAVAIVGILFIGCTAKADADQVEKRIVALFAEDGLTATATCPKAIEVKVGFTITCKAKFDNGEVFPIDATVTSKDGSKFVYALKQTEPGYVTAKIEKAITDGLVAQGYVAPTSMACGAPGMHHVPADHQVTCKMVNPSGEAHNVVMTFDEAGDAKDWKIVD